MAQRGYAAMSVDDIARAVGVSKPTIYLRYSAKERLTLAALEGISQDPKRTPVDTSRTLRDCLRRFDLDRECKRVDATGLVAAALLEREDMPELLPALNRSLIAPWADAVRQITTKAPYQDSNEKIAVAIGLFFAAAAVGSRTRKWVEYAEQLLQRV